MQDDPVVLLALTLDLTAPKQTANKAVCGSLRGERCCVGETLASHTLNDQHSVMSLGVRSLTSLNFERASGVCQALQVTKFIVAMCALGFSGCLIRFGRFSR